MPDPDFDMYDNVDRDADQIHAARFGNATRGDLFRWARRDAEPFLAKHPLPNEPLPHPDLTPYLAALAAAETPAEVHAVTNRLIEAAEPALVAVSDYLLATWRNQNRGAAKGSPPKQLLEAAGLCLSVLNLAEQADLTTLRAAYNPTPAVPSPPDLDRPVNGEKHNGEVPHPAADDPWTPAPVPPKPADYERDLDAAGYGDTQRQRYILEFGDDDEYAACQWDEMIVPAAEAAGIIPARPIEPVTPAEEARETARRPPIAPALPPAVSPAGRQTAHRVKR
ncbi:hypothetical protein ACWIG5_23925 [Streptomyces lydicus]